MKKKLILKVAVFSVFIYILAIVSCGGGGGGAGGASIPASEYSTHNPTGWAGGGYGGGGSSGSSGGSGGNSTNISISGGTPLNVTGYTYNGTNYTNLEALISDIVASGATGSFTVPFVTNGETRQARVTMNGNECTFEHQYKATTTINGTTVEIPFYKNDGISLTDIAALIGNETIDAGMSSEVVFELQKVKIGGVEYPTNGTIPASAISGNGDVTITGAQGVYEKWGISNGSPKVIQFSSSLNNGDSITISTTEPITNIYPPIGKQISLDLSGMSVSNTTYIQNFINPPSAVTELVLPNDIETLNTNAFSGCTNLTSITMSNNVQTIGNNAFSGCTNLTSITMSNNVQTIGNNAFSACINLTSITIPDSVTTIGTEVFFNCNELQSITLPNNSSFTEIPDQFFEYLSKLESITIPNNVTKIGLNAFIGCERLQSVTLPNNPGFTEIEAGAFQNCIQLESITIPDSVTTIGWSAFFGCESLQSVTLPNNTNFTEIGNSLFAGCESLESITIPASVTTIGQDAFKDCKKLNGISLPDSLTFVGISAFKNCFSDSSLQNANVTLYLPSNNTMQLGSSSFQDCTYLKKIVGGGNNANFVNGQTKDVNTYTSSTFQGCSHVKTIQLYNTNGKISIDAGMLKPFTEEKVEIQIAFPANIQSINLGSISSDTFTKTPYIHTNALNGWKEKFLVNMSGIDSWGGKDIIIKADNDTNYYKWNGSDFEVTTQPADWN